MIDIAKDEGLEALIHESKKLGYITPFDLLEDFDDKSPEIDQIIKSIISRSAKSKLITFRLIESLQNEVYPLTLRGRNFESFEKSNAEYILEQEKLQLEVEKLRNEIFDYPKVRSRSKRSEYYAVLAIVVSLLTIALQLICNKPD